MHLQTKEIGVVALWQHCTMDYFIICSNNLLSLVSYFFMNIFCCLPQPLQSKNNSLYHPRFVGVSFPHLDCGIIGHSSEQICSCSSRLDGECRWTAISGLTADFQLDSSLGSGCAAPEYQPSVFKPFFIFRFCCVL